MADSDWEPSIWELENLTETKNYRATQLEQWKAIHDEYTEARDKAVKHGATSEQATKYADEWIRGWVRYFIFDILQHAQREAAGIFFETAPIGWLDRAEVLLPSAEVPILIGKTYAQITWAQKVNRLTREAAEEKAEAEQKMREMMSSYYGPVEAGTVAIGRALGSVAEGAGAVVEGVGAVGQGIGAGLSGFGSVLKNLPMILGGVAATAVVVGVGMAVYSGNKHGESR